MPLGLRVVTWALGTFGIPWNILAYFGMLWEYLGALWEYLGVLWGALGYFGIL